MSYQPLGNAFKNMPGSDWAAVQQEAQTETTSQPTYKSNTVENVTFSGYFLATDATASLAILSDDGADVYINGQKVLSGYQNGQALPDLPHSLSQINYTFDPTHIYSIKIVYSNVFLTGPTDIDGVTLFCYNGGGVMAPVINVNTGAWQPNPAGVGQIITSHITTTVDNPYQSPSGDSISQHWNWITGGVYRSDDGTSGSFTPYTSGYGIAWSPGSSTTNFSGTFNATGYYIIKVTGTLTYHDDTTGKDSVTCHGDGYIGGSAGDLAPPPGSPAISVHQTLRPMGVPAPAAKGVPVGALFIHVNDTGDAVDDKYVRLKSSHPIGIFFTTPVTIVNPNPVVVTAKVTNPDGRLGFAATANPASDSPSLSVSVPANSVATFYTTGEAQSSQIGDAEIDVNDSSTGVSYAKKMITVFSFSNPQMTIAIGSNYSLLPIGNKIALIANPLNAVILSAQETVVPAGVNLAAPQIKKLQLGIIQNGYNRTDSFLFSNPQVIWSAGVTSGSITVYTSFGGNDNPVTKQTVDSASLADEPFFRRKAFDVATGLVPITAATTVCKDADDPTSVYPGFYVATGKDTNNIEENINYPLIQSTLNTKFEDWCTIYDSTLPIGTQDEWLCESSWALDIDITQKNLIATLGKTQNNTNFTDVPIETGSTYNDLLKADAGGLISGNLPSKTITYPNTQ